MASTYILKLSDSSYYVGSTGDLSGRLKKHSSGQVNSTKRKLPFELMYKEEFETKGQAQSREYQIKKWKSREAIEKLVNKVSSSNG